MVTAHPGENLLYPEPDPPPAADAYRRAFVEPEEFVNEEPEEELSEIESEETVSQEPSTESPSEPDKARVDGEEATPSVEELIAAAEQAGDWLRAGQLKLELMNLQGNPSGFQGESDSKTVKSLMAEIGDAETNRDWYAAGLAKFRLVSHQAAANPSGIAMEVAPTSDDAQELEAKIVAAEARGAWGESLKLKAQKIPGASL